MSQFNRFLWTGLVLGLAACGDDVTVTNPPEPPPPPTPGVTAVSVAPDGATINVGGTLGMTAAATLEPGAAAPTWAWSSSSAAATVAANGASATVTAVSVGSVGIRATATSGTSSASGVATVNVVAAAVCSISGVGVTPASADLVVNQTLQFAASVTGTNCVAGDLTVTWSVVGSPAGATINASGVFSATAAGNYVVRATSVKDGTKTTTAAVTVTVPAPATVSIQSITQFATNVPVDLTNVGGQIEITLNVDPGAAPQVTKAQALIDGIVVAEQIIASPSAMASAPETAPQTLVLSTNTRQVKAVGGVYVPVVHNGPRQITARIFVTASTVPAVSNAVPVVLQNADAWVPGTTPVLAPASLTPTFTTAGPTVWYKGDVTFAGGPNYIAFFPVTPTINATSAACGSSSDAAVGSPTGGLTLAGTFTCGSTVEGGVSITGWTVTPGTAPAPDFFYIAAVGVEAVGSPYTVDGSARYNLLGVGTLNNGNTVNIDNKAPAVVANEIGYLAGCSGTIPTPGCWVGASYDLLADFASTDAGTGVASEQLYERNSALVTPCTNTSWTLAGAAEDASPTRYDVCASATDNLGNMSGAVAGFNLFGIDKTAPTFAYVLDPSKVGATLFADTLSETVVTSILDYKVNDNNSGLDAALAMKVTLTTTLNGSCTPVISTTLAPELTPGVDRYLLVGQAADAGCADPGYYNWSARVEDRAGNTVTPITHRFGFEPGSPTIQAVNVHPLYGGTLASIVDVFATHTGASLQGAKQGIWYTTNATAVGFVYNLGDVFNTDWTTPLYLATPATGVALTVPATLTLSGIVIDSTVAPATSFDSVTTIINDVYTPYAGTLVHADTANTVIAAAFKDATKNSTSATVWANPNMGSATFSLVGACTFTYATPTNGPTIPTSVWVVNTAAANTYDVLFPISAAPTLISDNGTTRLYQYSVSSGTCASLGGALRLVAVKNDGAGLPVGYLVP